MKHLFPIFLFLILTASCVQPVDIPPAPQEVFVKCILMNDTVQTVELYYSGAIGADRFEPVENAVVRIATDTVKQSAVPPGSDPKPPYATYEFNYAGDGRYISDFQPHHRTYHLEVLIPGRERISSSVTYPTVPTVIGHFIPPMNWLNDDHDGLWDRLGEEGYFHLLPWNTDIRPYRAQIDELRKTVGDERLVHSQIPGTAFSLDSCPRILYIIGFNEKNGRLQRAQHLATTHRYVDPSNSIRRSYYSGDPVVRTESTVRLYYEYGIASAYDGLTLHDGYLRIVSPENYDNGLDSLYICSNTYVFVNDYPFRKFNFSNTFAIVGDISYDYWLGDGRAERSFLYFCSVSDSYDRYLQDVQRVLPNGDVLSTLYTDALKLYTNIEGGYGIFGAMSTQRYDCELHKLPGFGYPYDLGYDYGAPFNVSRSAPLPEL